METVLPLSAVHDVVPVKNEESTPCVYPSRTERSRIAAAGIAMKGSLLRLRPPSSSIVPTARAAQVAGLARNDNSRQYFRRTTKEDSLHTRSVADQISRVFIKNLPTTTTKQRNRDEN